MKCNKCNELENDNNSDTELETCGICKNEICYLCQDEWRNNSPLDWIIYVKNCNRLFVENLCEICFKSNFLKKSCDKNKTF